ncbi:hypothetical protein EG328_003387 [Venturia inaequalis]|uniref:Uncharacterized protein n=1 Tax=Venturia inaequalis TaxID=5025 RepID=A0A8H3VIU8_VENIN|nr:hypothetical protein EG328_003387 [Venturia inaequalis]KAE9989206.1 hypothetical protein EG327_002976 [Venturia inaequalis]RDI85268.1 hypothetical protein Vi05172_g4719 [Venturia inaequalis]
MLPTVTHLLFAFVLVLTLFTTSIQADDSDVCPGFNFAVWHSPVTDSQRTQQFGVVGSDCGEKIETATCPPGNPCTCSSLTCSSAPATINGFISHENLFYNCLPALHMGTCDWFQGTPGYGIEKCCRNDGLKNKARGLITNKQFDAINATNAMLDRHLLEYESALTKRGRGVKLVRARQKREMNEAMEREMGTGLMAWT